MGVVGVMGDRALGRLTMILAWDRTGLITVVAFRPLGVQGGVNGVDLLRFNTGRWGCDGGGLIVESDTDRNVVDLRVIDGLDGTMDDLGAGIDIVGFVIVVVAVAGLIDVIDGFLSRSRVINSLEMV